MNPTTYMNLSGKAVQYWLQKEKIPISNCMILVDDIALPFGRIRIKGKGSDGGHNGLRNINQTLGQSNYARLRFGIGDGFHKGSQIDYVLGKWNDDEYKELPDRIELCIEAIKDFGSIGLQRTMNQYNNK